MGYNLPSDIDPAACALIRHKVERLIGSYGCIRSDADDLEQELALQAHAASSRYDPARGSRTGFYDQVLSNKVCTVIDHATCMKRDRRRERPLNDERVILDYGIVEQIDLALDVQECLSRLTDDDRAIANLLITDSVAEVARWTRSTRGKVRSARNRIAKALAAKDLAPNSASDNQFSTQPRMY